MNYALLIGNALYDDPTLKQLKAPDADLRALVEVLQDAAIGGYRVQTAFNEPLEKVQYTIGELFADKKPDDLLLLYFSGHGVLDPQGRLCLAVRNTLSQRPRTSGIRADLLKDEMDDSRARRQVLILDCCHSGAFGAGRKGADALGQPAVLADTFGAQGRGRVVLTATDKTSAAWEGEQIIGGLENSLFTHYLIEGIRTGAAADEQGRVTAAKLYDYVYQRVTEATPNQRPRLFADDQEGQIVIARAHPPAPKAKPLPQDLLDDLNSPNLRTREGAVADLGRLLRDPALAQAARAKLEELHADDTLPKRVYDIVERVLTTDVSPPPPVVRAVPQPPTDWLTLTQPFPLALRRIPAGEFLMGSADSDKKAQPYEKPQHRVFVSEFYLVKTPITVAQWAAFVQATQYKTTAEQQGSGFAWTGSKWEEVRGANWQAPRGPGSDVKAKQAHPVTQISWDDACEFCRWLNTTPALKSLPSGFQFCLPTEAEWEKAARGADGRIYPWGDAAPDATYCNIGMNVEDTTPVERYSPKGDSPFGLQDMAGNVWEWCQSKYKPYPYKPDDGREVIDQSNDARVVRGGSWGDDSGLARAACRYGSFPDDRYDGFGFRICVRPSSL
jgi:formylglycine-generating enzyme required for sulfatase activity